MCTLPSPLHAQFYWFKSTANPVLTRTDNPAAFDYWYAITPAVVKEDSLFRMWYTGFNNSLQVYTIGCAESNNGVVWYKHSVTPVLNIVPGSLYEGSWLRASCVVKTDSGYRMYYQAVTSGLGVICTAASQDGLTWQRDTANPIILPTGGQSWDNKSIGTPSVLWMGPEDYRMWYAGIGTQSSIYIGYATSVNGIDWTRHAANPVLMPNTSQKWEASHVSTPRVLFHGDKFHMFYVGVNSSSIQSIGYATSLDGITWTRMSPSPVLVTGDYYSWDCNTLGDHTVIFDGDHYRLWYSAQGPGGWLIGYAISEVRLLSVENDLAGVQALSMAAFPNPFNPSTSIGFRVWGLGSGGSGLGSRWVKLAVYDLLGREVRVLVNEIKAAGNYQVQFEGAGLTSGVYFCRLESGGQSVTKRLMLLR